MDTLRNSNVKILVVGDLMIDHYLWGNCERISPEAPVQVVDVQRESEVLGGAGNVVNNLVTLGANVSIASVIGADDNGAEMIQMLKDIDVDTSSLVIQKGRKSSKKSRVIASNQQILRYDKESKDEVTIESIESLLYSVKESIEQFDIIIISDYGKGVVTHDVAQGVISLASKAEKKVLVDPKGSNYTKYIGAHLLTPNKKEAIEATGINIVDDHTLKSALLWLKNQCELDLSMITLSEDGIGIFDDVVKKFPTVAQEVFDVTGAGDTVIASLSFALASNKTIDEAASFANLAAGVVVGKIGSATATLDEIEIYEATLHKSSSDAHIKTLEEIELIVKHAKKAGKRVTFTNGCFDILHVGHVKYLQEAKSFGDILIVGLNSDASVKRLKGESRPINQEDDRAYLLAALEAVDYVVKFGEDTPHDLIKLLSPHTLVKGGDYEGKVVVGSAFSDQLKLVQFVDGKSTTRTIEKIKANS
ncbi:MAG: D-glycero-beta-D-manno-heptose-7-phosphate kinase [Helicobacteraceae bacterium]|nr:D-glycero-beta-D-manno-heptose-7-phosphate kinase [Helicobacteraceae bacterium]